MGVVAKVGFEGGHLDSGLVGGVVDKLSWR